MDDGRLPEFDFERIVNEDPIFGGRPKDASTDICKFYKANDCRRGAYCPYVHIKDKSVVVCKHWIRGLCKKGDDCEFLHVYDPVRMPACVFFVNHGICSNGDDCIFLHTNIRPSARECPNYNRGFCAEGPACKFKHVQRILCPSYLAGFCSEGALCKFAHPSFEQVKPEDMETSTKRQTLSASQFGSRQGVPICNRCRAPGHKVSNCPELANTGGNTNFHQSDGPRQNPAQMASGFLESMPFVPPMPMAGGAAAPSFVPPPLAPSMMTGALQSVGQALPPQSMSYKQVAAVTTPQIPQHQQHQQHPHPMPPMPPMQHQFPQHQPQQQQLHKLPPPPPHPGMPHQVPFFPPPPMPPHMHMPPPPHMMHQQPPQQPWMQGLQPPPPPPRGFRPSF